MGFGSKREGLGRRRRRLRLWGMPWMARFGEGVPRREAPPLPGRKQKHAHVQPLKWTLFSGIRSGADQPLLQDRRQNWKAFWAGPAQWSLFERQLFGVAKGLTV